jgi:hypothetical protein
MVARQQLMQSTSFCSISLTLLYRCLQLKFYFLHIHTNFSTTITTTTTAAAAATTTTTTAAAFSAGC